MAWLDDILGNIFNKKEEKRPQISTPTRQPLKLGSVQPQTISIQQPKRSPAVSVSAPKLSLNTQPKPDFKLNVAPKPAPVQPRPTFAQPRQQVAPAQQVAQQIQSQPKAPLMLKPEARQQYAQKQPVNPATLQANKPKPTFSLMPTASAQSTPVKSTVSQVPGISNETWGKMSTQAQADLRVQEHKAKQAKADVFNPLKIGGDVVKASLGVVPAAAKIGTDMIVDLGNRTADFGEAGATVIGELNGQNKKNEERIQRNVQDQQAMAESFINRARNAQTQEDFDKYVNQARSLLTGVSDDSDKLNALRYEGLKNTDPMKTVSNAGMTALDLATLGKGKMILEGAQLGTKVTAPVLGQLARNTAITGVQGAGIGGTYGGLGTMKDPNATAEDYMKNIGMGAFAGGALGVGAQVALPVAGVAAKQAVKGTESAIVRSANYGLKPPTNLSKDELYIASKVRQAREGYISPQDITVQEAAIYQNIQRKLGAKPGTPDGEMAVVDALGAHRDFETKRAVRKEKTLDGLEKSSKFAQEHLIPAGSMRGVGDDGLPLARRASQFEQDLQAAGVKPTVKPDSYVAQPKDIKKAIDAQIAKERLDLAYSLEANPRFPDGIPKIRPEDVMRISGLSPKELGIPPRYISKSALPIDEQALAHVRDRGAAGVANMSDDDYLSLVMDAIDANRNKTQIAKNIRELRNDPKIIERARQTLEQEKAQYGAPEVFEPSKGDLRAYQKMVEPSTETSPARPSVRRTGRTALDAEKSKSIAQSTKPPVGGKNLAKPEKVTSSSPNYTPLPEINKKPVRNLDKMFRSTRSIIERQGEAGQELAKGLRASRDTQEIYVGQLEKQMPSVMKLARKGKNALVNKDFENFVNATQGLERPRNEMVSKAVTEWQAVHPSIRERAVAAGLEVGDLGPNYYPHFIDYDAVFKDKNTYNQAINHLVKSGQAKTQEEAIKLLGYAKDVSRNREFGALEASRLVDLPFYDKTPNSFISYLNGSAKRIAHTETFGKGDEKALKLIAKIGKEGGDTEAAKNAYDIAVGARRYNDATENASRNIRKYITTTRLGLGALTNTSQSVNTGIVTGHLRTLGSMVKQLDKKNRDFVADTGVISEALLNDLRTQKGVESFSQKVVGKMINKVTAPGFGAVEKFNRSVAATAGRDYALRLAQKGDHATLRKLGVTGEISGKTLTEAQQIQAARAVVEKTQFKVDPQDLPGWVDTPGGKMVAQFRTFSYNQGKFFSNEVLKPAARGNLMPLARVMAALPLGYALYETRRMIDGRPEEEDKTKVAIQSFSKIGGAGLALDIYNSLNPVGSKYLPPDRRTSMATGAFGGPAAGIATNVVGAVSEAIQKKNIPESNPELEGKVAVKSEDGYNDLTSLARFGIQQVPVVGTPAANRILPYKKQSEADTGTKTAITGGPLSATSILDANKERAAQLKASLSEDDYAISQLSKKDQQKLIDSGAVTREKIDGLNNYIAGKKRELGYSNSSTTLPKDLPTTAKSIIEAHDALSEDERKTWATKPSSDKTVRETLSKWLGGEVELPKSISNGVAKDWADYEKGIKDGTINVLEREDTKKNILKKAYNEQINDVEREIYSLTKGELAHYTENGVLTEQNIKNALAVEQQLFDAGLIEKESLASKLGLGARGYKGKGGNGKGSKAKKVSLDAIRGADLSKTNTALARIIANAGKTKFNKGKNIAYKKRTVSKNIA